MLRCYGVTDGRRKKKGRGVGEFGKRLYICKQKESSNNYGRESEKAIIEKGKEYFRSIIIPAHLKNVEKLHLKSFNVNPFLVNYLASFLCGDTSSQSLAKALIYPRILGTSINTSFGQNLQVFISSLAEVAGRASGIDGIDIEFTDALDGRTKYCQCKAGPQTINADDVATIMGHFGHLQSKASHDRLPLQINDLIVGVLYGEPSELSANYKNINKAYPVYCGKEFWTHVTGDENFYFEFLKAFSDCVDDAEVQGGENLKNMVNVLAKEMELAIPV